MNADAREQPGLLDSRRRSRPVRGPRAASGTQGRLPDVLPRPQRAEEARVFVTTATVTTMYFQAMRDPQCEFS